MPGKKCLGLLFALLFAQAVLCQVTSPRTDTIPSATDKTLATDVSLDYDDELSQFGIFLDSLLAPRSNLLVNVSASNGYFNFRSNTPDKIDLKNKLIVSPTIGYFHKS